MPIRKSVRHAFTRDLREESFVRCGGTRGSQILIRPLGPRESKSKALVEHSRFFKTNIYSMCLFNRPCAGSGVFDIYYIRVAFAFDIFFFFRVAAIRRQKKKRKKLFPPPPSIFPSISYKIVRAFFFL